MKMMRWVKYLYRHAAEFIKLTNHNRIGLYAAQAAFFTILSAVPFLMLLAVSIKHFTNINIDEIISPILDFFPETVSEYIYGIIAEAVMRSKSVAVVSASVVSILWSSSRGTMAIYSGLNNIFGTVRPYKWLRARIISFCYNVIVVIAVVIAVIVLILVNVIFEIVFRFKFLWFFLILVSSFSAIYAFLPQRKENYISQLPGAVAAALGWIVFSYLFSLYTRYFSKFPMLYGSLTALALLMLWVYFCQYMFLIGAQINEIIHMNYRKVKKL